MYAEYLKDFASLPHMQQQIKTVLASLPRVIQQDLLEDPRFRITLEDYVPGRGVRMVMDVPGPIGSGSRCVVLRPKLEHMTAQFAQYVIAHELAHAYLRNGGWGEITDEEEAADALAASWGYDKPPRHLWV